MPQVRINDEVHTALKIRAVEQKREMGDLANIAIREYLGRARKATKAKGK